MIAAYKKKKKTNFRNLKGKKKIANLNSTK